MKIWLMWVLLIAVSLAAVWIGCGFIKCANRMKRPKGNKADRIIGNATDFFGVMCTAIGCVGAILSFACCVILTAYTISAACATAGGGGDKYTDLRRRQAEIEARLTDDRYYNSAERLNPDTVRIVIDWNTEIETKQRLQKNEWFGCLRPDIYDDLKVFQLEELNGLDGSEELEGLEEQKHDNQ